MEKKEPVELGLKLLGELKIVRHNEFRFITSDFGFVNSFIKMESQLFTFDQPYRIKEGRIVFIRQGSLQARINLIEYTLQSGIISLIAPNSIIQAIKISPDLDMKMMAIDNNFLPFTSKDDFLIHFPQYPNNVLLTLPLQEQTRIESYFTLIWDILQEATFRREVIQHLVASLLYNIECITNNTQTTTKHLTHQEDIFQRFISLVNTHSKKERNVSFYADKLCLTPRYLNTIIRQTSQQTIMDWINQSIIQEAKILLKHSDLLVYQISDELNFPNPSFFCKFFKRMTGKTPQEYQKKQ
ncbi:helix-turn-helix domain-containing protein [Bacteroides bouchesdurhonensis]